MKRTSLLPAASDSRPRPSRGGTGPVPGGHRETPGNHRGTTGRLPGRAPGQLDLLLAPGGRR